MGSGQLKPCLAGVIERPSVPAVWRVATSAIGPKSVLMDAVCMTSSTQAGRFFEVFRAVA